MKPPAKKNRRSALAPETAAAELPERREAQRADPPGPRPPSPGEHGRRLDFERLYAEWHAALAALHHPDGSEEARQARNDAYQAAERALLTTPAPVDWRLWMKWEALDVLVIGEATSGEYCDRRVIAALGSIKADVCRFLSGE